MTIGKLSGLEKVCDQNGDRESKNDKSCHMYSIGLKCVLAKYEKYGTLSIYVWLSIYFLYHLILDVIITEMLIKDPILTDIFTEWETCHCRWCVSAA